MDAARRAFTELHSNASPTDRLSDDRRLLFCRNAAAWRTTRHEPGRRRRVYSIADPSQTEQMLKIPRRNVDAVALITSPSLTRSFDQRDSRMGNVKNEYMYMLHDILNTLVCNTLESVVRVSSF